MLKLTPSHIVVLILLVFTVFCSIAALFALSLAALHLLPSSTALAVFEESASAGFATAVVTGLRLRR